MRPVATSQMCAGEPVVASLLPSGDQASDSPTVSFSPNVVINRLVSGSTNERGCRPNGRNECAIRRPDCLKHIKAGSAIDLDGLSRCSVPDVNGAVHAG